MHFKKLLAPAVAPLLFTAMFGLVACGDDSSSGATDVPVTPVPESSAAVPVPASSAVTPVPASSASVPVPTVTTYPALAASASLAYTSNVYASWKPFHFVTMETETTYYTADASEFSYVFSAYPVAGRVLWSNQSSSGYKAQCSLESTVPNLKGRACTVSEGTGYGMLLSYVNGDNDTYLRLWNYSRAMRAYHGVKLTPWITRSFLYDVIDNSSATDADLDIATSLILQYYKTGEQSFLADALSIASAIWDLEVNPSNYLLLSGDTDMWHSADPTYNLSYFSPVALRLFAMVDTNPDHKWTAVLDAMYAYMAKVQAAGTGVFPDWSNTAGVAVNPPNKAAGNENIGFTWHTFNKESVRIPWRIAWDYYWFQDARALAVLTGLNNFIVAKSGGDPSNKEALRIQYSWDPAKEDYAKNSAVPVQWLAAWCATGIGTNPTWLGACTNLVNAELPSNNNSSYFSDILLGLYSGLLNGAFVKPF